MAGNAGAVITADRQFYLLHLPLSVEGRDRLQDLALLLASSAVTLLSISSILPIHCFLGHLVGLIINLILE
jgi:hypothetical protein